MENEVFLSLRCEGKGWSGLSNNPHQVRKVKKGSLQEPTLSSTLIRISDISPYDSCVLCRVVRCFFSSNDISLFAAIHHSAVALEGQAIEKRASAEQQRNNLFYGRMK